MKIFWTLDFAPSPNSWVGIILPEINCRLWCKWVRQILLKGKFFKYRKHFTKNVSYGKHAQVYLVWVWMHFNMLATMWVGFWIKIATVPGGFRMINDTSLVSIKHFYLRFHESLKFPFTVCVCPCMLKTYPYHKTCHFNHSIYFKKKYNTVFIQPISFFWAFDHSYYGLFFSWLVCF